MAIITTTYEGPDLDGYGCAMAYAELLRAQGKDARAHVWGTPLLETQWFLETFNPPRAHGPSSDTASDVILLDASSLNSVPTPLTPNQIIEIIDHRIVHEAEKFPRAKAHIELVGAAATLVAERFKNARVEPSQESALFLYAGIISNTDNLTTTNTTQRDCDMAAWLKTISGAPDNFAEQLFSAKSDLSGQRLQQAMFGDLKTFTFGNTRVTIAQLELIGVQQLWGQRQQEIQSLLKKIHESERSDYTLLNMYDLQSKISHIVCVDQNTQTFLSDMPSATWDGPIAISPTLTLRKNISAWIAKKLS